MGYDTHSKFFGGSVNHKKHDQAASVTALYANVQ